MKVNGYANIALKLSPASNNNGNQPDKCRIFIKKLMQLGANDWPKFQEQLKKKLYSWNLNPQIKQKEPTTNTHITILKNICWKHWISN